ncbi:MAG: Hsp20/alpha crystallin family protein [Lachnospiraceae bacterium]|jgi:HSP20 family protein|nr:Hsp20/alpha crystallin family protein [Lachnospiraceae bacterium]MDE7058598.1 Hsp20/alpha crystallin family protein [Lachnospiraceae bacterium]
MLLTDIFGRNFMDDFFEDFANSSFYRSNRIGSIPAMKADVQELEGSYQIDLELPGFQKDDLHAELKDGYLTIKATRQGKEEEKDNKGRYIRQERYSGHYQRSFYVGEDITQEDVHAAFENGVLKLTVPKKEPQPKIQESKTILIEG